MIALPGVFAGEFQKKQKKFEKPLDKCVQIWYNIIRRREFPSGVKLGSLAQLGEHLPHKQRVTGSSPVVSTTNGRVVQLVRTLACHARGRGFEPHLGRHLPL